MTGTRDWPDLDTFLADHATRAARRRSSRDRRSRRRSPISFAAADSLARSTRPSARPTTESRKRRSTSIADEAVRQAASKGAGVRAFRLRGARRARRSTPTERFWSRIDPLDGSSNIDANTSIGTIVLGARRRRRETSTPARVLAARRRQRAAGFRALRPAYRLRLHDRLRRSHGDSRPATPTRSA